MTDTTYKSFDIEHRTGATRTVTVAEYSELIRRSNGWKIVGRNEEDKTQGGKIERPVATPVGRPAPPAIEKD